MNTIEKGTNNLDHAFWDEKYKNKATGWDLGVISPPLQTYFESLTDKNLAILIPGCGNSYEAEYLLAHGFTNITILDIAPTLVTILEQKFSANTNIQVVLGDFFEHQGAYDLIIEQTFFCALPIALRQAYVWKTHQLLRAEGILTGLLFNRLFDSGPPFGGTQSDYVALFREAFNLLVLEAASNSIAPRANTELTFQFQKHNSIVSLVTYEKPLPETVKASILNELEKNKAILNVSISSNSASVLLVTEAASSEKDFEKMLTLGGSYKFK